MSNKEEAWGTSGPDNAPPWARQYYANSVAPPYDDRTVWTMVHGAIARDPRLPDAADIEIAVDDGVVTLTGSVANREEKTAAEEDTRATAGVGDVFNRIQVAHP